MEVEEQEEEVLRIQEELARSRALAQWAALKFPLLLGTAYSVRDIKTFTSKHCTKISQDTLGDSWIIRD